MRSYGSVVVNEVIWALWMMGCHVTRMNESCHTYVNEGHVAVNEGHVVVNEVIWVMSRT